MAATARPLDHNKWPEFDSGSINCVSAEMAAEIARRWNAAPLAEELARMVLDNDDICSTHAWVADLARAYLAAVKGE